MMKRIANSLEWMLSLILGKLRSLLNLRRPATLLVYRSFGDSDRFFLRGRVVESFNRPEFFSGQTRANHFVRVVKLFLTFKVPGARVTVRSGQKSVSLVSNSQGFFSSIVEDSMTEGSAFMELQSTQDASLSATSLKYELEILRPSEKTRALIISDIDDTVLKSRATSFLRLALKTLFLPLGHREAFPESARFYQNLKRGSDGSSENLFFYVSSSTWNIYPLLDSFLKENDFPVGPIILQDVESESQDSETHSHYHKFKRIEEITSFYPDLPLILIGDAGQKDSLIYTDVMQRFPGRVQSVLIRKTWWTSLVAEDPKLLAEAQKQGVPAHYFENLEEVPFSWAQPD